jgi:hypothetical protein
MSSLIFRRRDFDPDTGNEIIYSNIPHGNAFTKTGQRRLYFTSLGLEYRQPVNDTNNSGVPTDPAVSGPIRIVDMGLGNTATGDRSAVVGGQNNHATASRSVVLGGVGITANVPNAVFVSGLHTQNYLSLAVYATVAAIPVDLTFEGALVYVTGTGLHVFNGSSWVAV